MILEEIIFAMSFCVVLIQTTDKLLKVFVIDKRFNSLLKVIVYPFKKKHGLRYVNLIV